MRIGTIIWNDRETASLCFTEGLLPVPLLNQRMRCQWLPGIFDLLVSGQYEEMLAWYNEKNRSGNLQEELFSLLIPGEKIESAPLYKSPGKIWGMAEMSDLLSEKDLPSYFIPGYLKPPSSVIGQGDFIKIPSFSRKTTASGELGIVIGKKARNLKQGNAMEVVAGYTPVIDVTAEDIHKINPEFRTLSKAFDSFFSFGPCLISKDEIPDYRKMIIQTLVNGETKAESSFPANTPCLEELLVFYSRVMTLLPGDILLTGTPGTAVITEGDRVECKMEGFPVLTNRVHDLRKGR